MESTKAAKPPRRFAMFASLENRNFRLLWIGMVITGVGMWVQMVAQGWLVLELTNSAFYLGLVGFMRAVPGILFSLWGGVLADRVDRRTLMMVNAVLFMICSFVLAALVWTGVVEVWHILLIAFLSATVGSLDMPARQALVPALVPKEQLMNAISLNSVAMHGPRIIGPSIAGALIPFVGLGGCFFVQGLTYIALMVALFMMQIPAFVSAARKASPWQNFTEGLRFVRKDSILLGLMIMAGVTSFFGLQYPNLLPVFARDVLESGTTGLGLLYTASGVGALITSLSLASLTNFKKKGLLTVIAILVFSAGVVGLSLSRWLPLSLVFIFTTGGTAGIFLSLNNTLVQLATPDHMRGRVMGMFSLTGTGLTPMGSLLAGSVASVAGAPLAVGVGAILVMISTVAVNAVVPKIKRLE